MNAARAQLLGWMRQSNGSLITPAICATAARLAWSNQAPLGSPVVPLVHTITAGSEVRPGRSVFVNGGPPMATL